jgi:hypothetical protein
MERPKDNNDIYIACVYSFESIFVSSKLVGPRLGTTHKMIRCACAVLVCSLHSCYRFVNRVEQG